MVRQHPVEGDLRQLVIRGDLGDGCQLIGLHVQARSITVASPGQCTLLIDEITALNANLFRFQVLEVERIADVGVVDFSQQALIQAALVLPVDHPALIFIVSLVFAIVIIVVEVSTTELTFTGFGQVAELAFHQHAALGHVAWIQGGVVVWRQVEVVRRDQHEAGVAAGAERRRQEAGLATVVDREVDVRCVEHREILDPQGDVGRSTEAGSRVQGDVVALELPGVAVRLTGGVGTILEADDGVLGTLGVQRATADTRLVHHVFGVVDLGFTGVELNVGMVADHQRTVVTDLDVAGEFATILGLVQVGLVGFNLHAALAHDHITGEGGDLLLLLVAGNLGADEGRGFVFWRGVIHARTGRLDIGAGTVRPGFGELGRGQLITWNPVQVTVVITAGFQATAFALGNEHRALAGLFDGFAGLSGGFTRRAGSCTRMHRTRRQRGSIGFGLAVPASGSGHLAVELLCGDHVRGGQRLQRQQTAGDQQREFFTKRGGFQCHLISPGFLRAICPRVGPHASRWSEKDAG
ncbi:hypothetical protein D3C77_163470 [compost metagenome]